MPKYLWLQKLPSNQVLKRGYEDKLLIEDTTYDHQGEYVCEAVNVIGDQKKIVQSDPIRIEVRGKAISYGKRAPRCSLSGTNVRYSTRKISTFSRSFLFAGAPQVLRYSVAKEVEAVSGRDVRLEMEVCSDPIPSKTTWDWGSLRVEAGQVNKYLISFVKPIILKMPPSACLLFGRQLVKSNNKNSKY